MFSVDHASAALIDGLLEEQSSIQDQMRRVDRQDQFPAGIFDQLRRSGVLAAPLPRSGGGLGWGTEGNGAPALWEALQAIGYGSLVVGRIFEAHVNAIALIFRYGDPAVRAAATAAVQDGHLFALWVTTAKEPVRVVRFGSTYRLTGRKAFCSAAGYATRAVITALNEQDLDQLFYVDATHVEVDSTPYLLGHGMRSTSTKPVIFDCDVSEALRVGAAGDYLREPDFSGGAWRTSAVTAGGLNALVDEAIRQLRSRDRHTDPHQAARAGQMLISSHTAAAWVRSAAQRSASDRYETGQLTGYVNLTRRVVESACLEVISLVQRSLGLAAFAASNPVEGMMRDLATYLRQPAGDEALTEAAIFFAETDFPSSLGDRM